MLHSTSGGTFIALPPVRRIKESVMENQLYCLLYRVLSVMTMILSCSWKLVLSCFLLSYCSGDTVIMNNVLAALLASESTVFYSFSLLWSLVATLPMFPTAARVTSGNASLPVSSLVHSEQKQLCQHKTGGSTKIEISSWEQDRKGWRILKEDYCQRSNHGLS